MVVVGRFLTFSRDWVITAAVDARLNCPLSDNHEAENAYEVEAQQELFCLAEKLCLVAKS